MFGDIPDGFGLRFIVAQVNLCHSEPHEEGVPNAVYGGWSEGDVAFGERLGQFGFSAFEADLAVVSNPADEVGSIVLRLW